jgi:hypothetical protein
MQTNSQAERKIRVYNNASLIRRRMPSVHEMSENTVAKLNRASVDLIHRILRDGILVYEAHRSARIHFEVQARREYLDLLPYLRQYRRAPRVSSCNDRR